MERSWISRSPHVSAVDTLLTAGRANSPTRALAPMKTATNPVTVITDNLRQFERRSQSDEVDLDALWPLRDRAEATLRNLVVAMKRYWAVPCQPSRCCCKPCGINNHGDHEDRLYRKSHPSRTRAVSRDATCHKQTRSWGEICGSGPSLPRSAPSNGTAPLRKHQ